MKETASEVQMDRRTLDAQFNLRLLIPDYRKYFDEWARRSEGTRQRLTCRLDVPYGKDPLEKLDIFPAEKDGAPVVVFIHGGYWQALDKKDCGFLAEGFVPFGLTTIILNYPLAPQVSMDEIVRGTRQALAWIRLRSDEFAGDPERIFVVGHSAGGQLLAMLLATNWPNLDGRLPADPIRGACAVSGLFDLEPIRNSYLNEVLKMDREMARRNSPIHFLPERPSPLILCVGGDETREYHRQSEEYARLWRAKGYPLEEIAIPGRHHYAMMAEVASPDSPLNQAIRQQVASS